MQSALNLVIDPDESGWLDCVVLMAMLVALRVAVYWVLLVRTSNKASLGGKRA